MAEFGVSYLGSKSRIATKILSLLPEAENLYDLFGGGFSVTHCAVLRFRHKWKHFHFNEINQGQTQFIQDCIAGKYSYENFKPKFVTRDEFYNSNDPYVKIIWSFSNNLKGYLYSKDIEPFKKSIHNAIVFNEFDDFAKEALGIHKFADSLSIQERKKYSSKAIRVTHKKLKYKHFSNLFQVENLELTRAQNLSQVSPFSNIITFTNLSYEQVTIKPNSVIYCDPPYCETAKYSKDGFDHAKFWTWVTENSNPVFVSEYNAPKWLHLIWAKSKTVFSGFSSPGKRLKSVEKLFANNAGYELWKKSTNSSAR